MEWWHMTLEGMLPIDEAAPVTHVSFYEADAFARWKGCRLPTEAEWETTAVQIPIQGNFLENQNFRPMAPEEKALAISSIPQQIWGDTWEWTSNSYRPYPGFKPLDKIVHESNEKFMCNHITLRGGSCVTPQSHIRSTYRNFHTPESRWQFTGIRLATQ
jgi:formylglycine-generating enzyme required for sulfatase activity